MSVWKKGDKRGDDEREAEKKKKDIGDEIAEGFEKLGKNFTKGIDNFFGGKEKKCAACPSSLLCARESLRLR